MADIGDMIRMLERVKKARNSSVPPKIATLMLQETRENFRKEGYTQDGGIKKWPQRSHEYMLNYPILDYTGRLKRSLTRDFSPKFARIGANAYYAQVQQEGGRAHNGFWSRRPPYSTEPFSGRIGKIIPRPFLGVGRKTYEGVRKIFTEEVRKAIYK